MSKLIVSFTTINRRIDKIEPMLDSIFRQTLRPDEVRLYLSHTVVVPSFLPDYIDRCGLNVRRCSEWGPATKLIPCLQEESDPETSIITVDDDFAYVPTLVEELVYWSKEFPDASIGRIGVTNAGRTYVHTEHCIGSPSPATVGLLGGYRGVLYKRRFFDLDDLCDQYSRTTPLGTICSDDHLFSYHLRDRGVPLLVMPLPRDPLPQGANLVQHVLSRSLELGPGIQQSSSPNSAKIVDKHFSHLAPEMEGVASYLPTLLGLVARTKGPVIELGAGCYSTPILDAVCHDRLLVTFEGSREWYDRYKHLSRLDHPIHHAADWDLCTLIDGHREEPYWDVALVDHDIPRRVHELERLRKKARFIVVHDTNPDVSHFYNHDEKLASFTYRMDFRKEYPWTTVVSMFSPIPQF